MYKIIDNFLDEKEFKEISLMTSTYFPWFMQERTSGQGDEERDKENLYFTHSFYTQSKWNSDFGKIVFPILNKLDIKALIRVKGNLYTRSEKLFVHNKHVDYEYKHEGALYYVNDNDGYTILDGGAKIESKKNRLLLFDPSLPHSSTTCTDSPSRINININFF
jgi:hypothetical protein